ncbi:hypothetical protein HMPREF0322_04929 [Desulfitobacterium hafniense DP7]|uniref:Uncharacterized protein n=1 Tax=Desulfitobacterium hafniense DP7 TaxID=537010 RepID=G9XVB6_DESHA|nr:hypothetical protein HMPREF0322_04929 [Desulfitobacterium hafniense DP7]
MPAKERVLKTGEKQVCKGCDTPASLRWLFFHDIDHLVDIAVEKLSNRFKNTLLP